MDSNSTGFEATAGGREKGDTGNCFNRNAARRLEIEEFKGLSTDFGEFWEILCPGLQPGALSRNHPQPPNSWRRMDLTNFRTDRYRREQVLHLEVIHRGATRLRTMKRRIHELSTFCDTFSATC